LSRCAPATRAGSAAGCSRATGCWFATAARSACPTTSGWRRARPAAASGSAWRSARRFRDDRADGAGHRVVSRQEPPGHRAVPAVSQGRRGAPCGGFAMTAPALMVQGTASSVGKSLLVTGLCRLFRRAGVRVAPFKSQNMALNSAVTLDGLEIGRAQAVQADAAEIAATVDMNPILLKPEGDRRSQVVVLGKPIGSMTAVEYHAYKPELSQVIAASLARLRAEYDLVVIEGAGSPAEINLKANEIVNMHVAELADARVVLAGDIDRGGVFAAFVGTLELLEPHERARIAAFVINKFRGDPALLEPGLRMLTERTRVPVLGVVPYLPNLRIADEDSVSLDDRARRRRPPRDQLDIAVFRLPRIANYDDVEPLEHEA